MSSIFDTLQIAFWSLTYVTIIACGFKHSEERKPMMPYVAGGLNLAWELNALLLYHHYGHIIWSGLDIMIFVLNLRNLKRHEKHRQYIYIYIVCHSRCRNNIWCVQTAERNADFLVYTRLDHGDRVCGLCQGDFSSWQTANCDFQIAWRPVCVAVLLQAEYIRWNRWRCGSPAEPVLSGVLHGGAQLPGKKERRSITHELDCGLVIQS